MSEVERSIESLLARVAALESENDRLRQAPNGQVTADGREVPRRTLLVAGMGLLGAAAGGDILAQGQTALAAAHESADAGAALASAVTGTQFAQPKLQGMRVKLPARRSSTALFARYEWSFGKQFTDAKPPIVLASVVDPVLNAPPGDAAVCSVFVYGNPGAYAAMITVHNLKDSAGEVDVNLLAFGG